MCCPDALFTLHSSPLPPLVLTCIRQGSLLVFGILHLLLVAKGRVSIAYADRTYDAGLRVNWRRVFGRRKLGWLLPVKGEPEGDGLHFEPSCPHPPHGCADCDDCAHPTHVDAEHCVPKAGGHAHAATTMDVCANQHDLGRKVE